MSPTYLVAIPTFRRVEMAGRLLDEMLTHVRGDDRGVLLLDNDPQFSAGALRTHAVLTGPHSSYLPVGAGGLSAVRNAAIEQAVRHGVDFLVFLDDDEIPVAGWLSALIATQERHDADVVAGPVRQSNHARRQPWVRAQLDRREHLEGPFEGDVGAGNVLMRVSFVRQHNLRFDPRLDRMGGEDTLFFRQGRRVQGRFVWSPVALATELSEAQRLTPSALTRRAFRNGQSSQLVDLALAQGARAPTRILAFASVVVLSLPRLLFFASVGRWDEAWRQYFRLVRHAGRLGAPTPKDRRGYHE